MKHGQIAYVWSGISKTVFEIFLPQVLKWSFTYKQHAWEPPQNHSWKFDLWPLQNEILKIKAGFAEKMPKKVEIITRTPAEVRPSDFSLRFLT